MHARLRLREQSLVGSPAKFVSGVSYDSALVKRLKLDRLLNGHGKGKARVGLAPSWYLVHVYVETVKVWQPYTNLLQGRQ